MPEFGPGVDQRQRVVLDQVGVDAPDGERGRDPQAVDPLLGGPRERLLGAQSALAHERMSRSTSSVRASISSLVERLQVEAQQRLGVRRPHVEVPVVVVDGDAVEPAHLAVGVALRDLLHLGVLVGHLGVDLAGDEVPLAVGLRAARDIVFPRIDSSSSTSSAGITPESAHQKSRK